MMFRYTAYLNLSKKVFRLYYESAPNDYVLASTLEFFTVSYGALDIELRKGNSLLIIDLDIDRVMTPDGSDFQIVESYKLSDVWKFSLICRNLFNPILFSSKFKLDEEE